MRVPLCAFWEDLQMLTVSIMLSEQQRDSPQYYESLILINFGPSHQKYHRI